MSRQSLSSSLRTFRPPFLAGEEESHDYEYRYLLPEGPAIEATIGFQPLVVHVPFPDAIAAALFDIDGSENEGRDRSDLCRYPIVCASVLCGSAPIHGSVIEIGAYQSLALLFAKPSNRASRASMGALVCGDCAALLKRCATRGTVVLLDPRTRCEPGGRHDHFSHWRFLALCPPIAN